MLSLVVRDFCVRLARMLWRWTGLCEFHVPFLTCFLAGFNFFGWCFFFPTACYRTISPIRFVSPFPSAPQMKIRPSIYSMFCPPPTTTLRGSPKNVVSLLLVFKAHFKVSAASAKVTKSGSLKPWRRSSLRRPRCHDHYRHRTTTMRCMEDEADWPKKNPKRRIRIINGKNKGERTRARSAIRSVASDMRLCLRV